MTKKEKIFESLNEAFPLKTIQNDRHLEAALLALKKVEGFLSKNPSHKDEILTYQSDLLALIEEFKNQHDIH